MPGEWHHLVAVKETGTLCLYHNGEKISSSGVGTLQLNDQVNYYLGQLRPQEGERQFCGEVDELAIYTYALTSEQIRQHYALIAPLDLPPNASTIFPSFH